jgi:hypothetical protein
MKFTSLTFLLTGAVFLLSSCNSAEKTASAPDSKLTTAQAAPVNPTTLGAKSAAKELASKGGQVVESGKYHLELVPEKSANETHLDLYLQKGDDHQAITNAKVSGEVQSPDGQSKTVAFTYDADGKHYAAVFPGKTAGAYQLKVTAAIGGDQADGRFSFDR